MRTLALSTDPRGGVLRRLAGVVGAFQAARRRDPRPGGVDAARRGEGVPRGPRCARSARERVERVASRRGWRRARRRKPSTGGRVDAARRARRIVARFGAGRFAQSAAFATWSFRVVKRSGGRDWSRASPGSASGPRAVLRRGSRRGRDGLGAENDARGFFRGAFKASDVRDVARDGVERGAFETAHQARGVPLCAPSSASAFSVGGSRAIRASRQTGGGERAERWRRRPSSAPSARGATPRRVRAGGPRWRALRATRARAGVGVRQVAGRRRASRRARSVIARTLARWHRRALAGAFATWAEAAAASSLRTQKLAAVVARWTSRDFTKSFNRWARVAGSGERRPCWRAPPPRACSAGAAGTLRGWASSAAALRPRRAGPFSSVGFVCDSPPRSTAGAPARGRVRRRGAPPRRGGRTGLVGGAFDAWLDTRRGSASARRPRDFRLTARAGEGVRGVGRERARTRASRASPRSGSGGRAALVAARAPGRVGRVGARRRRARALANRRDARRASLPAHRRGGGVRDLGRTASSALARAIVARVCERLVARARVGRKREGFSALAGVGRARRAWRRLAARARARVPSVARGRPRRARTAGRWRGTCWRACCAARRATPGTLGRRGAETKGNEANLKRCLTRKRVAQRWFLRWY